jgi:hypothetical protein
MQHETEPDVERQEQPREALHPNTPVNIAMNASICQESTQ